MKRWILAATVVSIALTLAPTAADDGVALSDASWVYNNLITDADPTVWKGATYQGEGRRVIWDVYNECWCEVGVYLFDGRFDGLPGVTEFQAHEEYGSVEAAREMVDVFGPIFGRLPRAMLVGARRVELSIGPPGGGAGASEGVFHYQTSDLEGDLRDGFMEEVLFHEGSHASVDPKYSQMPGWFAAQKADGYSFRPMPATTRTGRTWPRAFGGGSS